MNFQRVGVAVVGLLLLLPGLATSGCRLTPLAAAEPESIRGREEVRSVQEKSLTVSVHRTQQTAPMRALEPVEYAVELRGGAAPYTNPYDSDEIKIDAALKGPGGITLTLPGFWWEAPDSVSSTQNRAGFRVRITPTVPGEWELTVRAEDRSGVVFGQPLRFQAEKARGQGFVRRATGAGRKRYFELSDGLPFFLIGENLCWTRDPSGLKKYAEWLNSLRKNGANFIRVWMEPRGLEHKETGAGRYDPKNAAYFDELLDLADRNSIRCMFTLSTYGELVTGGYFGEGKWPQHPYNQANGGPVSTPEQFFTDAAARKLYRNRIRYLVARYGAHPALAFWEFWNEQNAPVAWFQEMIETVQKHDPYGRPITTSYSTTGPNAVWELPGMALTQTHRYGDDGSLRDIAPGIPGDTQAHARFDKPHLLSEFGISWRRSDEHFDPKGVGTNLHNGLWASALSGAAGGAMNWWWDSYIHPNGLEKTYLGLSRFAAVVDWPRRAFEPLDLPAPRLAESGPETFGDLTLTPEPVWEARSSGPAEVLPGGTVQGTSNLLAYLYGRPRGENRDIRSPQVFQVTLTRPGRFILRVDSVSDRSRLSIKVDDGKPITRDFDPTPGGAGSYKENKHLPDYDLYQARFDTVCEVPLSAGRHRITVEASSGDWIRVQSYTFTSARSSHLTTLRTLALQDSATCETLAWIQDPDSHWASDRDGKVPQNWKGVTVTVPVPRPGAYRVQWWDTRLGKVVQQTEARAGTSLLLQVPAFRRDIALRITAR